MIKKSDFIRKCKITFTKPDNTKDEKICNNFDECIDFCKKHEKLFFIITEDGITMAPGAPIKFEWIKE